MIIFVYGDNKTTPHSTNQKCTAETVEFLMGTLKPQSNGPLYSNAVTGTLAVN